MKFTKLRLKGLTTVDLPIKNATINDPFILKAADGLGPPEIDVFVAKTRDLGGYYKGRQTQYREPVLRIGLNANYKTGVMISDLRKQLYGMLTPNASEEIDLVVMDGNDELMYTSGYVKRLEIVPFNTTPEVQLTMSCLDTYFKAFTGIHVETYPGASFQVLNQGSAETGIRFQIKITGNLSWLIVTDARGKSLKINYQLRTNDILTVDTRPGSRSVTVVRDGVLHNIIYSLTTDSSWVYLYGGLNTLTFSTSNFTWNDLYYVPQYWGI